MRKDATKQYNRYRRSLKKTFSKKRNQRRAFYIGSAVVIVSLLLGFMVIKAQAQQEKKQYSHSIQQIEKQTEQKKEQVQQLSKELETLKQQKTVTETQLQEKAASEAQKQAEIDKLQAQLKAKAAVPKTATVRVSGRGGAVTAGNTYTYGYCTWYVKNRRPDIPNGWGNAMDWFPNAQASGWPTGSTPRVGAVGTQGNHVVYVEQVNGDGTVTISEMNYRGWNVASSRVASSSDFRYIY